MPIFEFECLACSRKFEKLIRAKEQTEKLVCPHCASKKLKRMFSMFGISAAKTGDDRGGEIPSGYSCSTCSSKNCATCR